MPARISDAERARLLLTGHDTYWSQWLAERHQNAWTVVKLSDPAEVAEVFAFHINKHSATERQTYEKFWRLYKDKCYANR